MARAQTGVRVPAPAAAPVRLSLLNGFRLSHDGRDVVLQPVAQRLLAFLVVQGRPVQRAHVAGSLWPDADESHGSANLRSTVWRLRRPDSPVIVATGSCLDLAPAVVVDVKEAVAQAQRLLDPKYELDGADEDLGLLVGDLLPDWWDDWLIIERERLRQLRIHALETLAAHLLAAGHAGKAIEVALVVVAAEPLRESAHRLVVQAHLAEGNAVEAVRQYRVFADLLRRELGVQPSARMRELLARVGVGLVTRP